MTPLTDLVLYDGDCGLCSRANRFILDRDRHARFRFAPLQGPLARTLLQRHGRDASALDTVYVVKEHDTPREALLTRSTAALYVLRRLGGPWLLSWPLALIPRPLRDRIYDLVARRRRRWFGGAESCPLPRPEHRARFLE